MYWNEKLAIMRNYDRSATAYDRQYAEEQTAKIRTILQKIGNSKVTFALDVGCGTGLLFTHIQAFVESLVGIDFSAKLLKKAKKRADHFINVAVVRADADHLPFVEQTFDAAFAITLVQNMPKPLETLREMEMVCEPDSILVVTWLKKEFSLKEFAELLDKAKLKIISIETNDQLKDNISVCRRL